jgi:hypothetical protein
MMKQWWEEGEILISEGFVSMWNLYSVKPEEIPEIVDKYRRTGANTVHFGAMQVGEGCGADYTKPIFNMTGRAGMDPDLLRIFIEEFHKHGIRIIIYFNGHSFVPQFYKDHPDWVQVYEDGTPALDIYGTGISACPNNSEYRKWQADVIRDLCQYEIDGVFLDGDIFFQKTCFCTTCKSKFKEKYGFELPSKQDRANPNWKYVREFQIDSLTEYVGHLYNALKEKRPQALLYCNAGLRTANWPTGRQNRRLMEVQDMLLAEGGFLYNNINLTPIWRTECEDKLCMTQSGGKPVISGMAIDHKSWNWYQLPPAEYKLMMYEAIVSGSHIYSGMSSPQNNIEGLIENIYSVYRFIKENEKTLYPTESLAKTAVVWSNVNADYYKGGSIRKTDFTQEAVFTNIGDLHKEFEGFYETCFRNNVPVDVIDEVSLTDGLINRYDTIILPNIACMSDEEIKAVNQFVYNGGTLIASFETSMYNEYGEMRDRFGLEDCFGVTLTTKESFGPLRFDYVMPVYDAPYTDQLKTYRYIPAPQYVKKTVNTSGERILDLAEFLKGSYDGQPPRSANGFCYINKYGKGKSIYFAGTIGQLLIELHFPEYIALTGKIIKDCSKDKVRVVKGPASMSINIRRNGQGKTLIYLLNYTGHMMRPITEMVEFLNVVIDVDYPVSNARTLFLKDNCKFDQKGDTCRITVNKLKELEIIELDGNSL